MKLQTVTCYAVEIPAKDGSYAMSRDRVLRSFPSTVVRVTAEDGTSGFAEACSLGGNYCDGFPGSIQATIQEVAPFVLQCDPLEPNVLADGMDALIIGHLPGKAAIDTAMWDLRGKLLGLPVARLLGGIKQESFGAFQAISLGPPATMAGTCPSPTRKPGHQGPDRNSTTAPFSGAMLPGWASMLTTTCSGRRFSS